ncbi:ABC transporter permease [Thiomicrorhabdus sp. 6S3-12]|uniref:ABC transporter permease n=1 Tax=Thiomicrorhabdus sp. 6S3-12 TaxID=2819681 RepID=UPI001AAD87E9|nr:ABC transporter permease [Thiomicrorhabdus sp. 6S3-12]MBO1923269.1 ABC transporter permease [Thiomicrorhabdus sp. 6S3-12]
MKILRIAGRNLWRYQRRTLLTTLLITLGVVAMLLFISTSGSFKNMMIGQITDSMLGHLQIHKKGYVSSIDSLPLTMNMKPKMVDKAEEALDAIPEIEGWSPRLKFGAMFSNFNETTNIRLNGVLPEREIQACPDLPGRILGEQPQQLVEPGKILIPELIAKGLKVKVGDSIVLVATNRDGSVNGMNFQVSGILEGLSGPGGRDGYLHLDDARELLRLESNEISEIAIRLKSPEQQKAVLQKLQQTLGTLQNQQGKPAFEIHSWEKLSPFSNIANMIDLMTLFIKIMLVAIVLISVMNVMIMAVYERVREIGTLAAMGTQPGTILKLFITEGLLLGIAGALIGVLISALVIFGLQQAELSFSFGRQSGLILDPQLALKDVLFASLIVIAAAVIASLQPAWKASKLNPVDALRQV